MGNGIDKISSYRTINILYGIHTKLYHIEYALYHTEKTMFSLLKINIVTSGTIVVSAILGLTLFFVQIADIKLSSTNAIIIFLILIPFILKFICDYKNALKAEDELNTVSGEIRKESLEASPQYHWDQAMGWAARILMAKEVLDENEKNIKQETYISTQKNFKRVLEDSKDKLEKIKKLCESSQLPDYHVINICKEYIEMANQYINIGK